MDGVSSAASIITLAGVGVQIAIKLATLATQISTASERITSIGDEISLTSIVLRQLGELMDQKTDNESTGIFSKDGLDTTRMSTAICERIFRELEKEARKASEQIRGSKRLKGGKVKLSKAEKAKWPFLQPGIESLRADLREAKGTLMLMLLVTSLAMSQRMADVDRSTISDFKRTILTLLQVQRQQKPLSEGLPPGEEDSGSDWDDSGSEVKRKLKVFLLKPIVRNFFDRIELTWLVQNPKMEDSAIRKYIAKNEDDGIPSVFEIFHTLDRYERTIIDSKTHDRASGGARSLLSLKRTKTEILHRNITIKDIPGLQFVVERETYPPKVPSWVSGQGMPSYAMSPPSWPQPITPLNTSYVNKRQKSIDSRGKQPTRKGVSHSSYPRPLGDLVPQIPDQDTTDDELFVIPSAIRAETSDKPRNHKGQYTSYVGSKTSFRGPKEGPGSQPDTHIPMEVSFPRLVSPNHLKRGTSTDSDLDLPLHKAPQKLVSPPEVDYQETRRRVSYKTDLDSAIRDYLNGFHYPTGDPRPCSSLPPSMKTSEQTPPAREEDQRKADDAEDRTQAPAAAAGNAPRKLLSIPKCMPRLSLSAMRNEHRPVTHQAASRLDRISPPLSIFPTQHCRSTALSLPPTVSSPPPEHGEDSASARPNLSPPPASTSSGYVSHMSDVPVFANSDIGTPPLGKIGDSTDPAPSAVPTQQGNPLDTMEPECLEGSGTESSSEEEEEEEGYTLEDMNAVVDELLGKYTTFFDSTGDVEMRD